MENLSPYAAPKSNVERAAHEFELPFFKSWLIFFLIAAVGGGVLGAILGAAIAAVLAPAGIGMGTIQIVSGALGFLIGLPISYFTFKWSVTKYLIGHPTIAKALGQGQI